MPYITKSERKILDPRIEEIGKLIQHEGQLNYIFFKLAIYYMNLFSWKYATLNTIKGVFSCCSDEFTRRFIEGYEDRKRKENGDITHNVFTS